MDSTQMDSTQMDSTHTDFMHTNSTQTCITHTNSTNNKPIHKLMFSEFGLEAWTTLMMEKLLAMTLLFKSTLMDHSSW